MEFTEVQECSEEDTFDDRRSRASCSSEEMSSETPVKPIKHRGAKAEDKKGKPKKQDEAKKKVESAPRRNASTSSAPKNPPRTSSSTREASNTQSNRNTIASFFERSALTQNTSEGKRRRT